MCDEKRKRTPYCGTCQVLVSWGITVINLEKVSLHQTWSSVLPWLQFDSKGPHMRTWRGCKPKVSACTQSISWLLLIRVYARKVFGSLQINASSPQHTAKFWLSGFLLTCPKATDNYNDPDVSDLKWSQTGSASILAIAPSVSSLCRKLVKGIKRINEQNQLTWLYMPRNVK